MTNYYSDYMSEDYDRLAELLDDGKVVVCYVDFVFDTGESRKVFRDVAKAKKRSERHVIGSPYYGYVVEARGIRYIDYENKQEQMRGVTFKSECERLRLQYIDLDYVEDRRDT